MQQSLGDAENHRGGVFASSQTACEKAQFVAKRPQCHGKTEGGAKKSGKKDLQTSEAGRKSQKSPTPVVGMKPYGKSQFNTNSPYLRVIDMTPHGLFGPWEAGFANDVVNINVASWTDTNIVITGFSGLAFNTFANAYQYQFQAGDQLRVVVENPQTQSGFATNTVTIPPGWLVVEVQAPTTGHPLVVSDSEFANLVNPILTQLAEQGLLANPSAVAATVAPNPGTFGGPKFDLAVIEFLLALPTNVGEPLADLPEIGGWWAAGETAVNIASGFTRLPTSPPEIAFDVVGEVLYYSQQAQEFLFRQPGILCYSFPMKGQSNQPQIENLEFFVCNAGFLNSGDYLKVVISLSALPQSSIDLRNILGNWGWGVADKTCGQITSLDTTDCNGLGAGLNVEEWSLATASPWGAPSFSAHVIDGVGNPVPATVLLPTGPPDCAIITSNSPPDGGTNSGGGLVYSNSTVTLTATPNSCYSFQMWTENGNFVSISTTYTFTATGNRNLTANFVTNIYTVTTSSSPPDGGTAGGAATVACGESITLVATNNLGYSFAGWTCNDNWVTNASPFTFTVSANSNLVANFSPVGSSIITAIASPPSVGSTTGGGLYTNGQSETLTATVTNSCYTFLNWTTNGTPAGASTNCPFTVATNQVFVANFAPIPYNIALGSLPSGGGTTSGSGAAGCGTNLTIYATPNPCYTFVNWTENGNMVSWFPYYTFTVGGARNLVANFTPTLYSISTSSLPSGGGATSGGGTVNCGTNLTVAAVPKSGYTFLDWLENGSAVSTSPSYSFTATGNRVLVASFVPNIPLLGFGSPLWSTNGFSLMLQGPLGSNYEIDGSTDFFHWLPFTNFTSTNSPFYFSDPAATNFNQRFYRAFMQ